MMRAKLHPSAKRPGRFYRKTQLHQDKTDNLQIHQTNAECDPNRQNTSTSTPQRSQYRVHSQAPTKRQVWQSATTAVPQCPTCCAACRCRESPGARLSWHPYPSRSALPHTPRQRRAETSCPFSPPTGGRECREPARSVPQIRTRIPFAGSTWHRRRGGRGGVSVKNARDQPGTAEREFCDEVKMGGVRL